jgi:hypothetical protein
MIRNLPELKEALLLWAIEKEGFLGRYTLVSVLELPDGITRGLLTRMARRGYIKSKKFVGSTLTRKGRMRLTELLSRLKIREIMDIDAGDLGFAPVSVAAHIRGGASSVRSGVEQRDAAIKSGAAGAITMIFRDGKFLLPPDLYDTSKRSRRVTDQLEERFKPSEGDVLIIGSADSRWRAVEGVLRAAETLS